MGTINFPVHASALATLLRPIATAETEVAVFAYFDASRRLLGVRHVSSGRPDTIDVPIRAVAADALVFGATEVVMAHNHPSGDLGFSEADLSLTRRLARGLDLLGVALTDHLLLTRDDCASLRALGGI